MRLRAGRISQHLHLHLLQCGGWRPLLRRVAPARDRGQLTTEVRGCVGGQADGGYHHGKGEGAGQGQDGEVVLCLDNIKLRMVGDSGDGVSVGHGVAGVVLAHQHLHLGSVHRTVGVQTEDAVGRGQDVELSDDAAPAPRLELALGDQSHLRKEEETDFKS